MSTNQNEPNCAPGTRSNANFTASKLRSRLDALEQQIASVESQMALLHAAREEVLHDLADITYPVLELPPEIISEIFLLCLLPNGYASRHTPLVLASICRLWRAVALSTCRLWTQLNFGWRPNPTAVVNRLECWILRAGGIPVDLEIHLPPSPSPESDSILRSVAQYSSRWGKLEFHSRGSITFPADEAGPFPALKSLSLRPGGLITIPGLCGSPLLREVRLEGVELVNWRSSLPWAQLTKLELWYHTVAECVDMLAHTPDLEILIFTTEASDPGFPPNAPEPSPCTLPRLHTLQIGLESSPELMEYLITPSLANLRLDWLTIECSEHMRGLITRSGCSLRTLVLWVYYPDLAPIFDCLLNAPPLHELQLTWLGARTEDYTSLFKFLFDWPSVLPALEAFTIHDCQINIDVVPLVRMLVARMEGVDEAPDPDSPDADLRDGTHGFPDDEEWLMTTPGANMSPKLKSFTLACGQDDRYEDGPNLRQHNLDVELALDRIRDLRFEGLKVDIQSSLKWFGRTINSEMIQEISS
ncbi:hypothetical protein C8R43DRAFT_1004451 [Mycena crocata]|nr:hypothetical protein C8R43DRAFT_1004451 [Mycena crocata]